MKRKLYVKVMVLLCMVYGATMGILSFAGTSALGLVAIIGAVVLGLGWAGMGMFTKPEQQRVP